MAGKRPDRVLPFEWLLPKVDVVVTEDGYGTVNQALSFGIPLVTAGRNGDKGEVNVRVAWSGVGVDLKTDSPKPAKIRAAVRTVLDGSAHRASAVALAGEFSRFDTAALILEIVTRHGGRPGDTARSPTGAAA